MIHQNLIEFYTKFQYNHEQINQLPMEMRIKKNE